MDRFPYNVPSELTTEEGAELEAIIAAGPPDWVKEMKDRMTEPTATPTTFEGENDDGIWYNDFTKQKCSGGAGYTPERGHSPQEDEQHANCNHPSQSRQDFNH